jgi:hypothetical protein
VGGGGDGYGPALVTPEALVAAASPTINALGSAFYFVPETLAAGKATGLDGFRLYFLGRGGPLGDVEPAVVASAFGYFAPPLVANLWESAKEKLAPRDAGRLYAEAAADLGRRKLADVEGLDAFCAAAEMVVASAERAGLALFAAWAAEPLTEDLPGRAMQLINVLREHRGSAHLVAVVAVGLAPAVAHAAKRPDMVQAFGYGEAPEVSDDDRALLQEAEVITDRIVTPAYAALTEAEAAALLHGLEAIEAALAG